MTSSTEVVTPHNDPHSSIPFVTSQHLNQTTPADGREMEECYLEFQNDALANDTSYCPVYWDGWGCWNYTRAGTRAFINCPSQIKGFDPRLMASRECTSDGTWWTSTITNKTWSDYTTCVNPFELHLDMQVVLIYFIGYGISMTVLLTSLIIFAIFNRQLKCDRVTLHKHLFVCNLFSCLAWIIYYVITVFGLDIIVENSIYCRLLHLASQYITVSMYLWMFCEGMYLHTVIVFGFTSGPKLLAACYFVGWVVPLITTCLYGALRGQSEDTADCWFHESKWAWINNGVVIFTFVANAIFLCNIIRVLITKLRAVNSSDANQVRKALRATMILVPLLGIQFIFFSSMPDEENSFSKVYQVLVALINSLQGFFLALLFCFLNGEVMQLLRRKVNVRCQQRSIRRRSSAHINSAVCTNVSYPLTEFPQHQLRTSFGSGNNNNNNNNNGPSYKSLAKTGGQKKLLLSAKPPVISNVETGSFRLSDCDSSKSGYCDKRRPLLKAAKRGRHGRQQKKVSVSFNGDVLGKT